MIRDLRYAVRYLWINKVFTIAAVLTLAIGLGANTALYGILNVTFRPLALPDAGELVAIAAEPDAWAKFQAGEGKAMGALVGHVMKASKGQADGKQVTALLNARKG